MPTTQTSTVQQLRDAYHRVNDRIADAAARSGRSARRVMMVAVTKTATPDQLRALVEMGHVDLGENRLQQLIQRVAMLEEFLAGGGGRGGGGGREQGEGQHGGRFRRADHAIKVP